MPPTLYVVGDPMNPQPPSGDRASRPSFFAGLVGLFRRDSQDSEDPAARSRRELYRAEGWLLRTCHRVEETDAELAGVRRQIEEFRRQHPRFFTHAGRNITTALTIGFLPALSWGLDFVILSPIIEFLLVWTGLTAPAETAPIGLRMLGSCIWMLLGYVLGGYAGITREQRRDLGPVWWTLAVFYAGAMPCLAWATASLSPDLQPLHRLGLTSMAVVGSIVPLLIGAVSSDAKDYLVFLLKLHRLRRRERILQAQRVRTGFRAVRRFGLLRRRAEEHERRFGDRFEIRLDDVSRRVIEEFSNGQIRIDFREPARPPARPDPVPPNGGEAGPTDGAGDGGDWREQAREYEAQLREQAAAMQDSVLEPPREDTFAIRLPDGR